MTNGKLKFNATNGLIIVICLSFFISWFSLKNLSLATFFACTGNLAKPWTFLVYPLGSSGFGQEFPYLILEAFWLYMIGSELESAWNWKKFLASFFVYGLASALICTLLGYFTSGQFALLGAWIPISGLTCAWAARNPMQVVRFMMVFPIQARFLALITALSDLFIYGTGNPLMGLGAASACVLGWFQGKGAFDLKNQKTVSGSRGGKAQTQREFESFIDNVNSRKKEREERDRLRKLLEGSLDDGPSDPVE